jgi:two-component system, LytTR family, sensor kinase
MLDRMSEAGVVLALLVVAALFTWVVLRLRQRRGLGTPAERITFETLHTASLAAPPLRLGLTEASAAKSARHLRTLLGTPAIAITDTSTTLVWEGPGEHHADRLLAAAAGPLQAGRSVVVTYGSLVCPDPDCPVRGAVVTPIAVDDRIVGTLAAVTSGEPGAGLVQAALETARWVSTQLELAELLSRSRRLAGSAARRAGSMDRAGRVRGDGLRLPAARG